MIKYDLTIIQGETYKKDLLFKSNELPYDLTGYTIKSQIKTFPGNHIVSEEFTCTMEPEDGMVHLELTSEQTNKLNKSMYFYDVLLYKEGVNSYYIGGKIFMKKHVTEPIINE